MTTLILFSNKTSKLYQLQGIFETSNDFTR